MVWACKLFRHYLWGRSFYLQMDHEALKWLMSTKDLTGRLARWSLKLQEYAFEIRYRRGKANGNADALTRLPITAADDEHVVIHLCAAHFGAENEETGRTKRQRTTTAVGAQCNTIALHTFDAALLAVSGFIVLLWTCLVYLQV